MDLERQLFVAAICADAAMLDQTLARFERIFSTGLAVTNLSAARVLSGDDPDLNVKWLVPCRCSPQLDEIVLCGGCGVVAASAAILGGHLDVLWRLIQHGVRFDCRLEPSYAEWEKQRIGTPSELSACEGWEKAFARGFEGLDSDSDSRGDSDRSSVDDPSVHEVMVGIPEVGDTHLVTQYAKLEPVSHPMIKRICCTLGSFYMWWLGSRSCARILSHARQVDEIKRLVAAGVSLPDPWSIGSALELCALNAIASQSWRLAAHLLCHSTPCQVTFCQRMTDEMKKSIVHNAVSHCMQRLMKRAVPDECLLRLLVRSAAEGTLGSFIEHMELSVRDAHIEVKNALVIVWRSVLRSAVNESAHQRLVTRIIDRAFLHFPKSVKACVWRFLIPVVVIQSDSMSAQCRESVDMLSTLQWPMVRVTVPEDSNQVAEVARGGGGGDIQVVIEDIEHLDPVAEQNNEELMATALIADELQADEAFASQVERQLHGPPVRNDSLGGECSPERVYLLRFGPGNWERLRAQLLGGPQMRPLLDENARAGFECQLGPTLMFIRPCQQDDVRRTLQEHELHPFHIVITESHEYLLEEILSRMPSRQRPREKPNTRTELNVGLSEDNGEEGEHEDNLIFVEKRTFICTAPIFRNASSVVQSTTEVVNQSSSFHYAYQRGYNPRRNV